MDRDRWPTGRGVLFLGLVVASFLRWAELPFDAPRLPALIRGLAGESAAGGARHWIGVNAWDGAVRPLGMQVPVWIAVASAGFGVLLAFLRAGGFLQRTRALEATLFAAAFVVVVAFGIETLGSDGRLGLGVFAGGALSYALLFAFVMEIRGERRAHSV